MSLVVVTENLSQRKRAAPTVLKFKANAVLYATAVPYSGTGQDGNSEYEINIGT